MTESKKKQYRPPSIATLDISRLSARFDMSLRDYFAASALIALIAKHDREGSGAPTDHREVACDAYQMADAMLREKGGTNS